MQQIDEICEFSSRVYLTRSNAILCQWRIVCSHQNHGMLYYIPWFWCEQTILQYDTIAAHREVKVTKKLFSTFRVCRAIGKKFKSFWWVQTITLVPTHSQNVENNYSSWLKKSILLGTNRNSQCSSIIPLRAETSLFSTTTKAVSFSVKQRMILCQLKNCFCLCQMNCSL